MMKATAFSAALVATLLASSPTPAAAHERKAFCDALRQAERGLSDQPLSITIFKLEPFELACARPDEQAYLCKALLAQLPLEHTHLYPYMVRDCLEGWGRAVKIGTTDGLTGLKARKIVRLESRSPKGVAWLLTFTPDPDNSLGGYFGRFDLTLTPKV
jgi:hypothetical protein